MRDRRRLGSDHPQTIRAIETLAAVLLDLGRVVEAESLARDALATRAGWPQSRPRATAFVRGVLGACLAAQGHDAEAERLLVAGYEDLAARPTHSRLHVRQALERIIAFYDSRGQTALAESWRARRLDANFPAEPFAGPLAPEIPGIDPQL